MKEDMLWELRTVEVREAIKAGKRLDGRALDEYRKIKIEKGIYTCADGSARVKIGDSEVLAGVKIIVGEPYPDSPDKGTISVGAELMPLASPEFLPGPPKVEAIELARVVDRGIREGGAIDFKDLCIKEGEEVMIVFIDLYVSDHDGNLLDCAALAAMSALQNTKVPKFDGKQKVKGETTGPLKIKRKPMLTTFAKIENTVMIDPNLAEEKALDARFSIATIDDNFLSAFQQGGQGSFTRDEISQMIDIAFVKGKELRKQVE